MGVLIETGSCVVDGTGSGSDEGSGVGEMPGADDASGTTVGTDVGEVVLRVVAAVASRVGACVVNSVCSVGVSTDEQASAREMSIPGNRTPHLASFRMGLPEHTGTGDATELLQALMCVVAWPGQSHRVACRLGREPPSTYA